jgi:hypothetical protein
MNNVLLEKILYKIVFNLINIICFIEDFDYFLNKVNIEILKINIYNKYSILIVNSHVFIYLFSIELLFYILELSIKSNTQISTYSFNNITSQVKMNETPIGIDNFFENIFKNDKIKKFIEYEIINLNISGNLDNLCIDNIISIIKIPKIYKETIDEFKIEQTNIYMNLFNDIMLQ